jgi:hypothetical protein
MKRYDLVQVNACYTTDHQMEPSEDGEWVRYEDVEHALGWDCDCDGGPQGDGLVSLPHKPNCKHLRCDCIASGNTNKPKQHGADPHAKNCAVYHG